MKGALSRAAQLLLVVAAVMGGVAVPASSAGAADAPVAEHAPRNFLVHWGTHVDSTQAVAAAGLLSSLDGSGYVHGLATEYGVSNAVAYAGAGVIPDASATAQPDPSTITSTVATAIVDGTLPAIADDANYIVMLPSGDPLPNDPKTGQPLCALHQPFTAGAESAHLVVLSDYTSTARQCGSSGSDPASAATIQLSREIVDTITDPAGDGTGVVQAGSSNEVGDACVGAGPIGNVDGWVVQPWWSNGSGACTLGSIGVGVTGDVDHVTNAQQATFLLHDTESGAKQAAFTCSVDGASTSCGTTQPLVVTGVTAGSHTVAVQASGVGSASFTWLVDLTPPVAVVTAPTAAFTVGKSLTVSYSGTDVGGAGVAAYDVRYRLAAWNGGFGKWNQPAAWQAITRSSVPMSVSPGRTYCFSVRAQDAAGNVQPTWSDARCTTVPVDDRALAATRTWTRMKSRPAYRGTLSRAVVPGARLRLVRARADQLALVVRTCPSCGRLAIYRSGVLWRTVNTHRATARNQVLVVLPRFSLRTLTIWLQPTTNKPVYVDGIAVRPL